MSDEEFKLLRDLIYQVSGLYFPDGKKYFLEIHLSRRLKELNLRSFKEYYDYLRSIKEGDPEWINLFNAVTTPETYFFRDPQHFETLEKHILPELIERRKPGLKVLRFWSAGCSSGEEPYTLSIVLLENSNGLLNGWSFKIIGTDISTVVLKKAKDGVYSEYAVRRVPKHLLRKYFIEVRGMYYVTAEVRKPVTLLRMNLFNEREMAGMRHFDVVFCRNVLIYFDKRSKEKILEGLYNSLNPGGYLFIGSTETLFGLNTKFKPVRFPKCVVYRKEE